MVSSQQSRIASIDLLRGLIMLVMALDHVRDYYHASAFLFYPEDPSQTTIPIYLTRWITHFCAPGFSFLAGISAALMSFRRSKTELSKFLLTRGIWLMVLEVTLISFLWSFDIQFRTTPLLVIWALGISMVFLAALVYLPRPVIAAFGLLLIIGHNALDGYRPEHNLLWSLIHQGGFFPFGKEHGLIIIYPLVPWIGVMAIGYAAGAMYRPEFSPQARRNILAISGTVCIFFFLLLRSTGLYGDPRPFHSWPTAVQSAMSFLSTSKYPPSLQFLLMTLGPSLLFLAFSEKWKGPLVRFVSVVGQVPFYYYIWHLFLIHTGALLLALLQGYPASAMVIVGFVDESAALKGYGVNLAGVYLVWLTIIATLYFICRPYARYKAAHKEKWWLSYL